MPQLCEPHDVPRTTVVVEATTWLVVLAGMAALLAIIGRRSRTRPGSAAAGTVYDLLQEDKRNALEIIECLDTLKGTGSEELAAVVTRLTSRMVVLAGIEPDDAAATARVTATNPPWNSFQ